MLLVMNSIPVSFLNADPTYSPSRGMGMTPVSNSYRLRPPGYSPFDFNDKTLFGTKRRRKDLWAPLTITCMALLVAEIANLPSLPGLRALQCEYRFTHEYLSTRNWRVGLDQAVS
jgi:hypothetical protein